MKKIENELPLMKFNVSDIVEFWQGDYWTRGKIIVCDHGGSLEHDYNNRLFTYLLL